MKKYDVTALGELLIDFTENGKSSQGNPLFEANPGGAPCNVLAMLAKLGHKTAFIGKVGNDFFGEQLRTAIKEAGIDDTGLCTDEKIHTTLAMVHTYPDGDRDFSFYRNPGADMMLNKAEIREDILKDTKIFHFGTLSMTHERYQIPLILVSMGKEGSRAYYNEMMVEVKPFLQENTIETTGAGDTFCGCVLHYVCEHGINGLKEENLAEMLTFANAAASIITTRKGALRVMPEEKEIKLLI